ncbi:hypothetical protein [Selenomonas sp. KH1T6]|uniref:hypothetical protein n=1 Tax=Selenomonas sp. KH1T6 TaxID=3158784 RepID=UPI0008A78B16|nr:hypothetical protein SAMN05216583_10413 [Selenomonas ruminantium]
MKRKIWAIITGQIRSELYFKVMLIKLCDLRAKGIVEEIVYSTWDDEINKYVGLREQLKLLHIIVVEAPMPDAKLERNFNPLSYEYQRSTLFNSCSVIPSDCFVIKFRTDLNQGVRPFFDFLAEGIKSIEERTEIKRFGAFPIMYEKKMVLEVYDTRHLMFCNDRFFGGWRNDLKKICNPISNFKTRKYHVFNENALLNGYAYHFFPLLCDSWNIISIEFYNVLQKYCADKQEKELVLPRLILRLYAMICVYMYTHITLVGWGVKTYNGPYSLRNFIKGDYLSDILIEKIVTGDLVQSRISALFKDEMRKIAINSPCVHGYTYEEYEELKRFTIEELKKPELIGEYPFATKCFMGDLDKSQAANILLRKYDDTKTINRIADCIDDCYNSFYQNIFSKFTKNSIGEELYLDMLIASVFDSNRCAIAEYVEMVVKQSCVANADIINNALRYVTTNVFQGNVDEYTIITTYYLLKIYREYDKFEINFDGFEVRLNSLIDRLFHRLLPENRMIIRDEVTFLNVLNDRLNSVHGFIEANELEIIKVLVRMAPLKMPLSSNVIDSLKKQHQNNVLLKLEKSYPAVFQEGDLVIPHKLETLIGKDDLCGVLSYTEMVKGGGASSEAILQYLLENQMKAFDANGILDTKLDLKKVIEKLSRNYSKASFLLRLNLFFITGKLSVSKDDVSDKRWFVMFIEVLYSKRLVQQNKHILTEMCNGDIERKMLYYIFLRLEKDSRLDFFSMKNGNEIWIYYVPYLQSEQRKHFQVPTQLDGKTWPGADRKNDSSFAAFVMLLGKSVYISIEFSAKDTARSRKLAEAVGFENKRNDDSLIRLTTKSFQFRDNKDLSQAIDKALDEMCSVGDRLMKSLKC